MRKIEMEFQADIKVEQHFTGRGFAAPLTSGDGVPG
jgi:hypothetical protein